MSCIPPAGLSLVCSGHTALTQSRPPSSLLQPAAGTDVISLCGFQSRGHQQEAVAAAAACVISMECSEAGKSTWGRDKFSNTLSVKMVLFFSSFHPSQEAEITNRRGTRSSCAAPHAQSGPAAGAWTHICACSPCPSSLRQLVPRHKVSHHRDYRHGAVQLGSTLSAQVRCFC